MFDQFPAKSPDRLRDDPHGKPVFFRVSLDPSAIQAPSASFVESKQQTDETKPIGRVERAANLADVVPQTVREEQVVAFDDYDSRRKRRVNPEQEVARRQKAARRREALTCASGY